MKKAAIYIRVSTKEQTEGYSINAQKDRLMNYCKAKEWNVYNIYIDAGHTGSNINRPALSKMIDDISNIAVVLVYKLDRLSRSQKDTLYLIEDVFLKNKTDFVSMNESFDTSTPLGRAMIGILSVFAQLEREQIKERMMMGREERAKNGYHHGGNFIPIGYDYGEDGILQVNEYEAIQIKEIVNLYLEGNGTNKILEIMKNKGYTHKYGEWTNLSAIYNALTNPVYTGKINFDGKVYNGKHEAIIGEETFKKVQELKEKRTTTTNFEGSHLLTGLIYCKHCGARYAVKNVRGRKWYGCYSRTKSNKRFVVDPDCKNKHWKINELNNKVYEHLLNLSLDFAEIPATKKDNKDAIKDRISKIDKQIEKLMDLYLDDNIPKDALSKKMDALNKEKDKLKEEIKNNASEKIDYDVVKYNLSTFEALWLEATEQERKTLIRGLVEAIYIDGDSIDIQMAF